MHTRNSLPIRSDPSARAINRHHSANYFVHRVKESLTTRISKIICAIFLSLLLCLGIVTFILWISLRPHRPRFHIRDFSVSDLDRPEGFETSQIGFKVTVRNPNQNVGIYYDSMEGSVYYKEKRVGSTRLLHPLYQEPKNTTWVNGVFGGPTLTVNKDRWIEMGRDRNRGKVVLRLEIVSLIRFKVYTWQSKSHRMHGNCNVVIGRDGMILSESKDKRCPVYFT